MIPPNYGIDYAREFRELYPQLAKKARVALVPFLLDGIARAPRPLPGRPAPPLRGRAAAHPRQRLADARAAAAPAAEAMTQLPVARERPAARVQLPLTAAQLAGWDAILDARSPSEFAEDHLPGAVNCPVLDDDERALVGTAYKQRGSFEAKRLGAPLVAANIARIIATRFADRPKGWRPLVYCWRGGSRSGALVHVLRQVGWDALQVEGGYKAFRRQVAADLEVMPARLAFRVVCGATGSGKSRLLEALATTRAQVLDLEVLAAHRGLGPGRASRAPRSRRRRPSRPRSGRRSRPSTRARPVFVESESRKVGNLRVPGGAHRPHARGRVPAPGGGAGGPRGAPARGLRAPRGEPAACCARSSRCLRAPARHGKDRALERARRKRATGRRSWRTSSRPTTIPPTTARCSATTRGAASAAAVPVRDASREAFLALARSNRGGVRRLGRRGATSSRFRKVTTCMPGRCACRSLPRRAPARPRAGC